MRLPWFGAREIIREYRESCRDLAKFAQECFFFSSELDIIMVKRSIGVG